ncbi:hypothetical protein JOF48_003530 [Arthrobacter stackebrandtii]|uniref:Uncharacterized protein n=1 Tax=Arthrobacter stackebrandtii TaxID=272161 RepID=A0ABS4Z105_9MICC|nr:hypothetical protein [Arthrobacter stackebrandtii]
MIEVRKASVASFSLHPVGAGEEEVRMPTPEGR